jgi:hypothetical protein
VKVALGTEDTPRPDSSRVLVTGNAALRSLVRALEASRALISASTRVRSSSSGAHRWVLAVSSSSGARRRIAASFRRRSPSVRSGGSGGGAAVMTGHRWRRPTAAGPGPRAAPARARPRPLAGPQCRARRPGWNARPRRATGRTRPPGPALPRMLPPRARRAGCSARPAPGQPGVPGRGGAGDERFGDRAERAEFLLRCGPGPDCPPGRGPRAAVMLIAD